MPFSLALKSMSQQLASHRTAIYNAGIWTALLILTVSVASFSPELAFVSAISVSSSPYFQICNCDGDVRVPLDVPGERLCLPKDMLKRSSIDVLIPTLFAAIIVSSSAFLLKSLGFPQN